MKVTCSVLLLALAFLGGACEKQSYSESRAFTRHGESGDKHKADAQGAGEATPAKPDTAEPAAP